MAKKQSPRLPVSASPSLPEAPSMASELKPAAGTPKRRRLTESVPDQELVQRHLDDREEAFYAQHSWNGKELFPMTRGRSSQFFKLRLADNAPSFAECRRESMGFLGDAIRILYLCSHEPRDWAMLRGSSILFLEQIEEWAEANIKPDQEKKAISIALDIFNNSRVQEAQPAPDDSGKRKAPGE